MNYTFPPNTLIPGGAFFVLAASPQGIANVYGLTTNVFGPYNGSLKKSETLQLLDEQSNVLLTVPYSNVYPWPVAADGTGHSIVLANPTYGEGDPRAWDISDTWADRPARWTRFHPSPLRTWSSMKSCRIRKTRRAAVHRTLQSQHQQRGRFGLYFDR
jgi:hypothetical protein